MKPQHRCGVQVENARKGAPVLVFALLCASVNAVTSTTGNIAPLASSSAEPARSVAKPSSVVLPAPYPTVHPFPVIDPKKALTGTVLQDALRRGGLVLYLRHTESGPTTLQCTTSNLTRQGEADAVNIGLAIRELNVPIAKIFSSDICRVRDTARLLDLGTVEVNEDLTNVRKREGHDLAAARMKLIATQPPAGMNHLLVGHLHGGEREDQAIYLDFGELIVFRPDGFGGSAAVARIRIDDWQKLGVGSKTTRQPGVR